MTLNQSVITVSLRRDRISARNSATPSLYNPPQLHMKHSQCLDADGHIFKVTNHLGDNTESSDDKAGETGERAYSDGRSRVGGSGSGGGTGG